MSFELKVCQLEKLFKSQFFESEKTLLQSGAQEPLFKASFDDQPAIIYSREDFFASALHEVAHWCIAGTQRRALDDYGYWYEPEGRNIQQQAKFEQVEVKPQALEWLFSLACDHPFNFSADNLDGEVVIKDSFKREVVAQAQDYLQHGLPNRAQHFFNSLNCYFRDDKKVSLFDV